MNRIKKAVIAISITTMLFGSLTSTVLANSIVYEKIEDETISSGVTHKNILRFGEKGWLQLNAVYIDLNNQNTELKLLQSEGGLSTRDTLTSMTKKEENTIASINADFFFMQNPSSPTGAIVRDGEMISSPVIGEELATFHISDGGQAFADYWDYDIYITTDKDKRIELGSINKYRWEYREIMLVDRNWGMYSPGATEQHWDMVEIVVENDEVIEVRSRQPSVEIPENGYVLLACAAKSYELYNNLQVGDIVTLHTDITPDINKIKLAVGGGTVLVKEGQVVPAFTQNVSGAHPRTAIGITKERDQIILVTIDGRHTSYKGVDGKQLAEMLIELGSYEAIIMDGGGSTSMRTRPQGEFNTILASNYSEGSERRISNGLAVVSKAANSNLKEIKLELDDTRGFVGSSRKINLKAIDENYNPLEIDYSKVNLSLKKGEGTFDGMYFTPTKAGEVVIQAEYLGNITEVNLEVLEDLSYIKITPNPIQIKQGQNIYFNVVGVDSEGYSAKLNIKDITWIDQKGLGIFKDGVYLSGEKYGTTIIEAHFGYRTDITTVTIEELEPKDISETDNIVPKVDKISEEKINLNIIQDKYNRPYEVEGEKLFIHSGVKFAQYTLLDRILMNRIADLTNNNALSIFTGSIDPKLQNNIKKEIISAKSGYSSKEQGNNLIIQLDNQIDGIRQTNFNQWPWFQNLIKNTNKKNVFVVMSKPIYGSGGFTDKLEAKLLMDTLSNLTKEGKKVFVLYEGQNLSVDIIEGVRYISTGVYNSDATKDPNEAFKYVEFNINDTEVTYQIKSLFE